MTTTKQSQARKRAAKLNRKLWRHYERTGVLTTAKVQEIAGSTTQANQIIKRLQAHGLETPPVISMYEYQLVRRAAAMCRAAGPAGIIPGRQAMEIARAGGRKAELNRILGRMRSMGLEVPAVDWKLPYKTNNVNLKDVGRVYGGITLCEAEKLSQQLLADQKCPVCGQRGQGYLVILHGKRFDGLPVLHCMSCGMLDAEDIPYVEIPASLFVDEKMARNGKGE